MSSAAASLADSESRAGGRESSALELLTQVLRPLLDDASVTELCINRPGELFVERQNGWSRQECGAITLEWCYRFAKLVANFTHQRVDQSAPLLSACLPSGERVQLVLPPASGAGRVAICIRRPATRSWSLAELSGCGLFDQTRVCLSDADGAEAELQDLLGSGRYEEFLRRAVRSRRNIVVSGPTGSGKTTCTKALIAEIPSQERLITIEDTQELVLDRHPNHVRLLYSKDDQGSARVTPKQLLDACLRMKPDRILLAELRAEEAFDYLRNVNSGHPGSITSVHATSAMLAFEQLVLLVKQSAAGRELSRADIRQLLFLVIDIVVQFEVRAGRRRVTEVWYDPCRKRASQCAD